MSNTQPAPGSIRLRIGGITDMSTVDWYGNVSLVVFFAGCNFRCPYCQNSELIPLYSGQEVELDLLRERIEVNLMFLDAVVFTRGELLLQPEGVMEAAKLVKEYGLKLMLDTNGSYPQALERILNTGMVDRVALDVKAPLDPEDYGKASGLHARGGKVAQAVGNAIKICKAHGVELEARTTVAPTISDDPDSIRRIASVIKDTCTVYYLQQFDNQGKILSPKLKDMNPPSREKMISLAEIALSEGVENVFIKTRAEGLERIG